MEQFSEDDYRLIGFSSMEGVGPHALQQFLRAARTAGVSVEDYVRQEPGRALVPEADTDVAEAARRGRAVRRRIEQAGGRVLVAGRPGYPKRLGEVEGPGGPPVLFARGEPDLLQGGGVAVVGSRRPSGTALRAARRLAGELAGAGSVIVSGGARGIDTAAHRAALRRGTTVLVTPLGLERFRWRRFRPEPRHDGRWCVVSQFPPGSGWHDAHALMRNALIVALSEAVVAFEPRDTGGTWNACQHALAMRRPLFIVAGSPSGAKERGRRKLVRMGAAALDPDCLPDAREFAELVEQYRPPRCPEQGGLFEVEKGPTERAPGEPD